MKKGIILGLALVGAMAMSCNKENASVEPSNGTTFTFVSAKPQFENETKTAWENGDVVWKEGDRVRVGCVKDDASWISGTGNTVAASSASFYPCDALIADASVANFRLSNSFTNINEGSYVFYSAYPYTFIPSNPLPSAPNVIATIPANQSLSTYSFNGSYDFMVGKSEEFNVSSKTSFSSTTALNMHWKRVVAQCLINIINLPTSEANESATSIVLTAAGGVNVVGDATFNLTTGNITNIANGSNNVSINGSLPLAGASVSTWATVLPFSTNVLTIVVKTNKATYTRTVSPCDLEFVADKRNVLNVNMSSAVVSAPSTDPVLLYTLDTSSNAGTNQSYTSNCDVEVNGITWNVTGNAQMQPWRLGGKNTTAAVKNVYTKTAFDNEITSIDLTLGTKSNGATLNSVALVYSTDSNFANATRIEGSATLGLQTFEPAEGFPANCYFKFEISVTSSSSKSNNYVEFNKVEFYGLPTL